MAELDPPAFLAGESRRIWVATVAQLMQAGTTARVNPDALLAYVSAVASHQRATALLSQTDILVERGGKPVANPALDVQAKAAQVIARFSRQYGLNRAAGAPVAGPMGPNNPTLTTTPDQGRWCDEHERWECTRNRSRGRGPCHGPSVLGMTACRAHAGVDIHSNAGHLLALQARKNPIAGQPMDIGPAEALLWRVRVLAGEVQRLDDLIAGLEQDELVWGVVSEETTETDAGPQVKSTSQSRISVWLVLRSQRERALQDACEAALRANIEERLVRLAESQGAVIHHLLLTVLADFGIEQDDPRIPMIIPARLRELSA
jgi:P27 family predicted phage terminase small subunit